MSETVHPSIHQKERTDARNQDNTLRNRCRRRRPRSDARAGIGIGIVATDGGACPDRAGGTYGAAEAIETMNGFGRTARTNGFETTATADSLGVRARGRTALTARPSVWSSRPATQRSRAQPCSPPGERSSGRPADFCRPSWLRGSSVLSAAVPASTSSARPSVRIETALGGEEIGAALASAWHEKGFTGKGVKVAIVDGGFMGLADRQAAGDLPAERRDPGLLRG